MCSDASRAGLVSPSRLVISNTWHLSDAFWNARVSARQVGLFVPVTILTLLWVLFSKRKMATRPEVPKETLDPSIWRLGSARPWAYTENIMILEARTLLFAVRHAWEHSPRSRLLFLVDNGWCCVGCSPAFRTGCWLTFRWIPSEVNFADEDHGSSMRTTIHRSVCCLTLMPGSPNVSSKKK